MNHGSQSRRRSIWLSALGLLLAIGVGGEAAAGAVPPETLREARIEWGNCPVTPPPKTHCGTLTVPEDWSHAATSRRIEMPFAVIGSKDADPRPDPVAFLTGGPGVTAFFVLPLLGEAPFVEHRNVIVMEPRGSGYAKPALLCSGGTAGLAQCERAFRDSGVDPDQYRTESLAHDLEALRLALGVAQWNLYGVSFGTFWALHHVRLYPAAVRSMILESPDPPQAGYAWTRTAALNAFDRVFDACRADIGCNADYPDLRHRFVDVLRRSANTKIQPGLDSRSSGDLFSILYHHLYSTLSLAQVPRLVDAAARGDMETVVASVPTWGTAPEAFDAGKFVASGLNASVECADDIFQPVTLDTRISFRRPWPADVIALIRPEGWNYDQICSAWKVTRAADTLGLAVHSDVPTLILDGAFDPITPPEWAEATALTLSRSTVLVDPSAAHFVLLTRHTCVWQAVRDLLRDPGSEIDLGCVGAIAPVRWQPRAARAN